KTLTLNKFDVPTERILAFHLERSIKERATAIQIYGPAELIQTTLYLSAGALTEIPTGIDLEQWSDNTGMHSSPARNTWQITDPFLRKMGRKLLTPSVSAVSAGVFATQFSCAFPCLEVTYDGGQNWEILFLAAIDPANGIV